MNTSLTSVSYSPQEQAIATGSCVGKNNPPSYHARFQKIFRRCFENMVPYVDVNRAKYFTESMKETEGLPLVLRYALAMKHLAEKLPVYIEEDQLLVGRVGTNKGRYGLLYPEIIGDIMGEGLEAAQNNLSAPLHVDVEDLRFVKEKIVPYWKDKAFHKKLIQSIPNEFRKFTYATPDGSVPRPYVGEQASMNGCLQWVPDYDKIIRKGAAAIRKEAEERLAHLDRNNAKDLWEKEFFLKAMVTICNALVIWANRHAEAARRLAAAESDPIRRVELENIAENCMRVPEFPAETFHQAMQSMWFVQSMVRLERCVGFMLGNGRMDQYLYPYYKADIESGRLDDEKVLELLDCLWLQEAQFLNLPISAQSATQHEGYAHWEAATVGGQTSDGQDATNELSYLILRSRRECPLQQPDLAVRIHARSPEAFLWAVAETVKVGQGFPKLYNDEEIIPLHLAKGAPLLDIMDYCASGCTEIRMPNVDSYTSPCTQTNCTAAVETTLFNGRLKSYGEDLFSMETGDPCTFRTWEEFWDAFKKQIQFMMRYALFLQYQIQEQRGQTYAAPMEDALHDKAFAACMDLDTPRNIPGTLDLGFVECIGFATAVDSLAAIKQFVFDDKVFTMRELLDALECNFEGKEHVRRVLRSGHCYGNNDPYADNIGRDIEAACQEILSQNFMNTGVHLDLRMVSITANIPFGRILGASPNGRLAGMPVSDGSSASQGMDVNGPTAVLLSNFHSKNWASTSRAARLLNIKFTPGAVAGDEGTRRLISFFRAFCDLKLWHVQFNVINQKTLIDAQKNPKKYRNLMVRVAGYSAYFVELSTALQNDIISRNAHNDFGAA